MNLHVPALSGHLLRRFVGRVAGLSASSLITLRAQNTLEHFAKIRELEFQLDNLSQDLAPQLHVMIDGLEDRRLRRSLLQLKRDVHNQRPLRIKRLEASSAELPETLNQNLRHYHDVHHRLQGLEKSAREVFDRELVDIRTRFQVFVDQEDFKKGLLLSSRSLARELPRYQRAAADRPGSKARQIERSLMRYFARATMKATPFSTFCALIPGRFHKSSEDQDSTSQDSTSQDSTSQSSAGQKTTNGTTPFVGDPLRKRGVLRLNKSLYARILEHLQQRPEVRGYFQVELNPTLREEGSDRWLFLAAAHGREIFQRLPRNAVLEVLRQRLDEGDVTFDRLIDVLLLHPEIEAEEDEATGYVDRLLEIGFLRFRIGIREQEVDWDRPLIAILEPIDDEHAAAVRDFLKKIRFRLAEFAEASASERIDILAQATADLKALNTALGHEILATSKPIFYEDAGGEAEIHLDLGDLETVLVEYVEQVSRVAWPRGEQATMRHFFDTHYGSEQGPVSLLRFYEDYFREHFKQHLEREQRKQFAAVAGQDGENEAYDFTNPFGLDVVRAIEDAGRDLAKHLRQLWRAHPEAEEIRLEREKLEAILARVPEEGRVCRSTSLFVQWVPGAKEGEPSALIANSSLNGYGKYFSRFLSVLPDEVRRDLIANNSQLTDQDLAEICGDGAHNANLHPPLLPHEISYPTGESGNAEAQIPSAEIEVGRDPDDPHRLRLQHAGDGRGIVPVDLGFLNPRLRPPLYRLLSRFTPAANFVPALPSSLEDDIDGDTNSDEETLQYRPRLTYRGRLILARRQWRIPLSAFPMRGKKETEADYFLRVQRWRLDLGLPEDVFLRVMPLPPKTRQNGESAHPNPNPPARPQPQLLQQQQQQQQQLPHPQPRLREHLYKPQYIDFRNPLLVDLFSRAAENLERAFFTFEERLPREDQLLVSGDERCVTEFVVQVDFPQAEGHHASAS